MEFYYNPYAWIPVYAFVLHLSLAALVFLAAPHRTVNRVLGAVLFANSLADVGTILMWSLDYPDVRAAWVTGAIAVLVAYATWLPLLGYALDTPLTKPFRTWWGLAIGGGYHVSLIGILLWDESLLVGEVRVGNFARFDFRPGPFYTVPIILFMLLNLFALVASISAYRRTRPRTLGRIRAGAFLVGFGTANVTNVVSLFLARASAQGERISAAEVMPQMALAITNVTVFSVALVYGILKAQMFDVRLRIRWTVGRGGLAATFVAVFLVVGQLAESFAGQVFGDQAWILGAIASGLLLFAIHPLQRAAERIANAIVPNPAPMASLPIADRIALYREQLEAAWEDGALSKSERRVLEVSRARLGLSLEQAGQVERQVLD